MRVQAASHRQFLRTSGLAADPLAGPEIASRSAEAPAPRLKIEGRARYRAFAPDTQSGAPGSLIVG